MFDNSIINVAIGLIFIFMLYSLFATAVQEAIANLLQRRANMLFYGIKCMFTNTINNNNTSKLRLIFYFILKSIGSWLLSIKSFFVRKPIDNIHEKFYNHPIIKNYGQNSVFNKPSYLSPDNFSTIIIDTLKNINKENEDKPATFELIKAVLDKYKTGTDPKLAFYTGVIQKTNSTDKLKRTLLQKIGAAFNSVSWKKICDFFLSRDIRIVAEEPPAIPAETLNILYYHLQESGGDLNVFRQRIEQWFNDTMNRVTGWYKKNTHYWLFCIGMCLAISLNIDTIQITNYLSKNKQAAADLAKLGEAAANSGRGYSPLDSAITQAALDSIKKDMAQVNTLVGLGWGDYGRTKTAFVADLKTKCWAAPIPNWHKILWIVPVWPRWVTLQDTFNYVRDSVIKDSLINLDTLYTRKLDTVTNHRDLYKAARDLTRSKIDSVLYDSVNAKFNETAAVADIYRNKKDSIIDVIAYDRLTDTFPIRMKAHYIRKHVNPQKFFGFLITAIAIGLGAPFWYDLLNKIVSIRAAGKTATAKKSSEDKEQADG